MKSEHGSAAEYTSLAVETVRTGRSRSLGRLPRSVGSDAVAATGSPTTAVSRSAECARCASRRTHRFGAKRHRISYDARRCRGATVLRLRGDDVAEPRGRRSGDDPSTGGLLATANTIGKSDVYVSRAGAQNGVSRLDVLGSVRPVDLIGSRSSEERRAAARHARAIVRRRCGVLAVIANLPGTFAPDSKLA